MMTSTDLSRDIRSHRTHQVEADLTHTWVITVLSNPVRYRRRYELYHPFHDMCRAAGVKLVTVEQAFGTRPFMVTEKGNPYHLQVRTHEELWHKENMINMGIRHVQFLDHLANKVMWIDADCRPARPPRDWFEETWHQLEHYEFVQMWEQIFDLDYNYNPIGKPGPSFMANYIKYGTPYPKSLKIGTSGLPYDNSDAPVSWGSPGLAWAANMDALNKIGLLPDYAILGAGDWYLAHMLISSLNLPDMDRYSPGYRNKFLQQQELCERWIKRDVGYVSGLVYHDWHGKKVDRKYNTRERILIENQYDPNTDIKYDSHGLIALETWQPRQIKLRDQVRAYFRARNEDSIDL